MAKSTLKNIKGILVGGDIAFAGQKKEYDFARKFLKEMTEQLEIDEKSVYCVPGNHDVNQALIRNSNSILNAQSEIEEANTIDNAIIHLGNILQMRHVRICYTSRLVNIMILQCRMVVI